MEAVKTTPGETKVILSLLNNEARQQLVGRKVKVWAYGGNWMQEWVLIIVARSNKVLCLSDDGTIRAAYGGMLTLQNEV